MAEKSEKNARKRGTGRPFVKGQVANPGGRPKIPEDIKQAFKDLTPKAIETLQKILDDDNAKYADKIKAAEIIMDRGYGKPTQALDVDVNKLPQVIFMGEEDVPF